VGPPPKDPLKSLIENILSVFLYVILWLNMLVGGILLLKSARSSVTAAEFVYR